MFAILENKIPIFKISPVSMLCALAEATTINSTTSVLNTNEKIFLCFDRKDTAKIKTPSPREIIIGITGRKKKGQKKHNGSENSRFCIYSINYNRGKHYNHAY